MAKPIKSSGSQAGKRRAALTPEGRENQLIDLAVSLVEKRLLEGTASSQEVTTILKPVSYTHLDVYKRQLKN